MRTRDTFALVTVILTLSFSAHADWMGDAMSSAGQAVAGNPSQGDCVGGFDEKNERFSYEVFEENKSHESGCSAGESWAECAKRRFLGK